MRTTGVSINEEGPIVLTFGVLDDHNNLTEVSLNVDPYAIVLVRDLAAALAERCPE